MSWYLKNFGLSNRFLQIPFQKFPPSTSVDADEINFDLNRFDSANIYQIQVRAQMSLID